MTPTLASITLQLLIAHNAELCGLHKVSDAHRDKAMDLMYWYEIPTATPIRSN